MERVFQVSLKLTLTALALQLLWSAATAATA